MAHVLRIALSCTDRTGLVADFCGRLFDLGADFGDTAFATLGGRAEFTVVCDIPDGTSAGEVDAALRSLPDMASPKAILSVAEADGPDSTPDEDRISHRVTVSGGNRPGLLTRMAEAFGDYGANIRRMDSRVVREGETLHYVIRFDVQVPDEKEQVCLATIKNTAEELGLTCLLETV